MKGYKSMRRSQRKYVSQLRKLVKVYQNAICFGINTMTPVDIEKLIHQENITMFYQESCQSYIKELNRLKITGKGEIFYKNELYHAKDAVASMIKQHIEILKYFMEEIFQNSETILDMHNRYVNFLNEFVNQL